MTNLRHNLLKKNDQNVIKMSELNLPILRRDGGGFFTIPVTLLAAGRLSHVNRAEGYKQSFSLLPAYLG
jgi:hypothetical protein